MNNEINSHQNADFNVDASDVALRIGLVTLSAKASCDVLDDPEVHLELTMFGAGTMTGHQLAAVLAKQLNEMLARRMQELQTVPEPSEEEESWQSQLNDEPII